MNSPFDKSSAQVVSRTSPVVETVPPSRGIRISSLQRTVVLIDEAHKERTWADEYTPFKVQLERHGTLVVNKDRPMTERHLEGVVLLVIGGPECPWLIGRGADKWCDEEIAVIQGFVENGGGLLILGDSLANAENMSALTVPFGVVLTRDLVRDVTLQQDDILPHEIVSGVRAIRLGALRGGGGMYLKVAEPAITVLQHEERPVLAVSQIGRGQVVVMSSLAAFSEGFLHAADNEALLDKLLSAVLQKAPSSEASDVANDGSVEEVELPDHEIDPASRKIEAPWRTTLDSLIGVWETWNHAFQAFSTEYEVAKDATYPTERDLLMELWARDIRHWQPRFLDLMREEVNLWREIEASDSFDETQYRLLHSLQVNRSMAIWQRQQHLEILKHQYEAMEARDMFAVDELLKDALEIGKASSLLRNDYAELLQALQLSGLPLPQEHIPELEPVEEQDREIGHFVIERLLSVSEFSRESEPDHWKLMLEDWLEANVGAEVATDGEEHFEEGSRRRSFGVSD
ncbi:MAG: hypothetical protein GTO14_13190 [Anaerolineales bacterium]|nr:hypothetical protein [Anaerolineales bacterium]